MLVEVGSSFALLLLVIGVIFTILAWSANSRIDARLNRLSEQLRVDDIRLKSLENRVYNKPVSPLDAVRGKAGTGTIEFDFSEQLKKLKP